MSFTQAVVDHVANQVMKLLIIVAVAAACLGGLAVWGLPIIWHHLVS
jgi:hypothetical protein